MSAAPPHCPLPSPPYPAEIQARFDALMPPGVAPLVLFRALARDQRLFQRFMGAGLLDKGHLTLRQREIVIDRVTARCGSNTSGACTSPSSPSAPASTRPNSARWCAAVPTMPAGAPRTSLLIRFCDALHAACDIDDACGPSCAPRFSEEAMLELLLLAGFYRTVSYLTNALRLPLEPYAARFPA
jgi:alkylhydroperoxidase family enzyme